MKLEFVKPMASTATCALTLAGTPTPGTGWIETAATRGR
jgi:hypothetical protein